MDIDIKIYVTTSGKTPFAEWLLSIDVQTRAIVRTRIDRMRLGNFGDAKLLVGCEGIRENK
jgi:putative component of toxin-antitoxin plasmid stabilization module